MLLLAGLPVFHCFSQPVIDEVGGFVGYSNYLGDLVVPIYTFRQSSLAGGGFCKKQLNANFALQANLLIGKLKGSDLFYERNTSRGISFEGTILEVSVVAEYDLLGQRRSPKSGGNRAILSPYFFAGAGFMAMGQSIRYGRADNPDVAAVYSPVHPAFPLGMGLRKDISNNTYLAAEMGMRLTFSDYLDGVKLSGDPTDNDVYFLGGLKFAYRLRGRALPDQITF